MNRAIQLVTVVTAGLLGMAPPVFAGHPAPEIGWVASVPGLTTGGCSRREIGRRTDMIDQTAIRPVRSLLRPVEWMRAVGYWTALLDDREASDLTPYGEVEDSAYFINRMGKRQLTADEIVRGPLAVASLKGPWTVVQVDERSVPRLTAMDRNGSRWELLFDSRAYPEMATGAYLVSSRLLWAAGYFVRPSALVRIQTSEFRTAKEIVWIDKYGEVRDHGPPLEEVFARLSRNPDGSLRAVAVFVPPGEVCGPWPFSGQRKDDPNGIVMNQHRRSLRGLRWFAAWLNMIGSSQHFTSSRWVRSDDDGNGLLIHFLERLEQSLGSNESRPRSPRDGHGYYFNPWAVLRQIGTLGFYQEDFENDRASGVRGIGHFESLRFRPETWRGYFPNPAFQSATALDGYWAAKILSSFGTREIEAAVEAAGYTDPAAQRDLVRILSERRDKITAWLFRNSLAVDNFRVSRSPEGNWDFLFDDLAVDRRLIRPSEASYRFLLRPRGFVEADLASLGGLINRFADNGSSRRILIDFELARRIRSYPPIRFSQEPVRWEMILVGRYGRVAPFSQAGNVPAPDPEGAAARMVEFVEQIEVPSPEQTLQAMGGRVRLSYERTVNETLMPGLPREFTPSLAGSRPPPVRILLAYEPETDQLVIEGWER
ncbi:MAG: hypothetical protein KIT79_13835 [Deltaproteobacteria bacterium]|nr:hypothetical protein [Deltaproteobacteria bacterium]